MTDERADWAVFFDEGRAYHRTAQRSVRRPTVFTPAIIQGVAAMSIEKYFMALFLRRGSLPRNHTLRDLVEETRDFARIDPSLEETLLFMDSLQRICSLDHFEVVEPSVADVPRFIDAVDRVAAFVEAEIGAMGEGG